MSGEKLRVFNNYIVINSPQLLCYYFVQSDFWFITTETMMFTTNPSPFRVLQLCHWLPRESRDPWAFPFIFFTTCWMLAKQVHLAKDAEYIHHHPHVLTILMILYHCTCRRFGFFFFQEFLRRVSNLPNCMKFWDGKISFKASMLNKKKMAT